MYIDLAEQTVSEFDKSIDIIINKRYAEIVEKGGRGSTKSQIISMAILVGCHAKKTNAVCLVKYKNGIKDRLVNTFESSIRYLGIEKFWKLKKAPYELLLLNSKGRETGYSIKFSGCDEPGKLKSFRPGKGHFSYIWFEEVTDFHGMNEINSIIDTLSRGGRSIIVFSYNPPPNPKNWVNEEFEDRTKNNSRYVHHSTYLDVIKERPDFLGESFINRAEQARENNEEFYRHNYLGEVIGTEGNVFKNVYMLKPGMEVDTSEIFRGIDFGFGKSPVAYTEWSYDKKSHCIFCINEYVKVGVTNATIVYEIKQRNKHNFRVWADSAEPRTINELNILGLKCVGVKKGPDSVRHGVKWLQSLNGIYIDPDKCPITYKQFSSYTYIVNKYGEYTGELPDKEDDTIDSARYALWTKMNS